MRNTSSKWVTAGSYLLTLSLLGPAGCGATRSAKVAVPDSGEPTASAATSHANREEPPAAPSAGDYAALPPGEPEGAPPSPQPRGGSADPQDGYSFSDSAEPAGAAPAKGAAPSSAPKRAPASGYGASPATESEAAPGARSRSAAGASNHDQRAAAAVPAPERPGLGTEWGHTVASPITERRFERQSATNPQGVAVFYYNDREGAHALTRYDDYRESGDATIAIPSMHVTVSIRDEHGSTLPAIFAQGRTYAIGEAGQNYVIAIRNDAGFSVETVASVDGLDVMDGRSADYAKRGYLISPHDSIDIEGFRKSSQAVAAFRFGSVRDSYAARTGTDRNVGVIGVAVFAPRGSAWSDREIARRNDANPFPGRSWAAPPRW